MEEKNSNIGSLVGEDAKIDLSELEPRVTSLLIRALALCYEANEMDVEKEDLLTLVGETWKTMEWVRTRSDEKATY